MENTQKGIAISSQHGKVDIAFTDILRQTNDENDSYITTITGPDQSVARIITNGLEHGTYAGKLCRAIWTVLEQNPNWADGIIAAEEGHQNRLETALDERATAELWDRSEPRYYVTVIASEFDKCQNVHFYLFHTEMSNEELAPLVVLAPGRTIDDVANWYTASVIEQTFSKAEVRQLHAYFSQFGGMRLKAKRVQPPDNHCIGYGAYPVGGGTDFYTFSEADDYSLPFKVWGFFDLRDRETALRVKQES